MFRSDLRGQNSNVVGLTFLWSFVLLPHIHAAPIEASSSLGGAWPLRPTVSWGYCHFCACVFSLPLVVIVPVTAAGAGVSLWAVQAPRAILAALIDP